MSAFTPFDPTDEDRANNDVVKTREEIDRLKQTLNPDIAKRVSEIYARKPYIPASVILAMAKQGVSDDTVEAASKAGFTANLNQYDPDKKKQSWFERNVYGKFKTATRWTFAGLQLAPDLVQNFAADAFSPNDPAGNDGWFKSTNLGSLIENSSEAGTGFFVGGETMKKQADRARRYRGTISVRQEDGTVKEQAWTIGRGAAQVAFTPGSVAYNVMSGFFDAAVQFVDPTIVGGKAVAGIKAGRAAIPLVGAADEISVVGRLAEKGFAGLDSAEQGIFNASKFGKWVTTDNRAKRLTSRINEIAGRADATVETRTRQILELFDYNISPDIARSFAEADDVTKVHGILGEASARLTQNPDDVLLPRDVREITAARPLVGWLDKTTEKTPFFRDVRNSRWFAEVPRNSVIINGTGLDQAQSIKNYENYLVGVGVKKGTAEFDSVMDRIVFAFSEPDKAAGRVTLKDAHDEVLSMVWRQAGGKGDVLPEILKTMRDGLEEARVYNIDGTGKIDDGGFVQQLRSLLPDDVFDRIPPDAWDKLTLVGPGALAQLADDMLILPDFRAMRRLAGSARLVTTVKGGARAGESRFPLVAAEFVQNEIWKPLTLMTGGYILRNMIDAQTRIAMTGMSGMFNHPRDFILWMTHRKGFEDIRGEQFENVLKQKVREWPGEMTKLQEALTFDARRALDDPITARARLLENGNFAIVDATSTKAHNLGYVDNLGQLFGDEINRQLARLQAMGLPEEERIRLVKEWLFSDEGAKARAEATRYLTNGVRVADPENPSQWHIIAVDTADDDVLAAWVDRLSTFKTNTVLRGDTDLAIVSGYNKVPLMETVGGKTSVVAPIRRSVDDISPSDIMVGDGKAGSIINIDGKQGLVISRSGDELTIQFVYDIDAFTPDRLGSTQLRNLLDLKRSQNKLAQKITKAERGDIEDQTLAQKFLAGKDAVVNGFFTGLYGYATQILEKSPLFRQAYYREVGDLIEGLAPSEAKAILDRVMSASAAEGIAPARYVGNKKILAKLQKASEAKPKVGPRITTATENFTDDFVAAQEEMASAIITGTDRSYLDAISLYKSRGFSRINRMLRSGKTDETTDAIDRLISISPALDKDIVLFRGISGEEATRILGLSEGSVFSDRAFLSTTANPSLADDMAEGGVRLKINVPEGTKGVWTDSFIDPSVSSFEDELLLGRDVQLVIRRKSTVPSSGISRGPVTEIEVDVVRSTGLAVGTVDELDTYAKAVALNFVKSTLYNATERNNLEDTLRVILPFGSAWKEVMGTYAKAVLQDPTRIRRAQLVFDGARKFDPDGDGQGFFYRDATSGEYSFNFPLSGSLAKLVTSAGGGPGLETPLQARVKGVSIGLGVIPALGPVGQIAYSKLAPDTPDLDFITKALLPYGKKDRIEFTPRWLSRIGEAIEGNTLNMQTVYANTYVETLRALSASGEYDLSDPNEQERLYADAKSKAKVIAVLRAVGQFIGPAAPSPEFTVETKQGDFYGTQLVKEFQKLQAENYDTAVERFLDIYGNDAILYISNKTESVAGGLEATEEFGNWEREGGDALIRRYPNVAGFMAPGGSDFSFEVWSRQVEKGRRRRLTDQEIIDLAQYRAASAQYRALREKLPPNPSDEQKAWLRRWRIELNKEYPGFPAVAEFNPGEFPARIAEMKRMVQDSSLADNDIAGALKEYLDARDKAVGRYVAAGGAESGFATAQAAGPLRDWLANFGRVLKQEVPEFARIYDRILSNEVDA